MQQWIYDLEDKELMEAAAISRDACNYHDHGSYLIIAYLQQAAKRLSQKKPVEQV